jgi:hypothetical protein
MDGRLICNEQDSQWTETIGSQSHALPVYLRPSNEENHENPQSLLVSLPRFRAEFFPNRSQKRYRLRRCGLCDVPCRYCPQELEY